jgi:tetratricopeptide (TPR) repeat protein
MSAVEPIVLVLEDLQWSDLATIDLLSLLGQRQEAAKLLLIGTSRYAEIQRADHPLNSVMRSLVTRSGALTVQVSRVGTDEVQHFIDRRFAGHRLPSQLAPLVAGITGGTPLFMVSLLDDLVNRGMIAQGVEGFELTVSLEDVQAHRPSSVKQLIDIQLDRLAPTEQRVLEAASIVGIEFSSDLAAAALELTVEQVDDICDTLCRRGLFLRAEPDARYAFTHALVQEVCVERSSPIRQRRWHRLVAEALAKDVRANDFSHLLAHHFDAAGEAPRAVAAYAAAARQAARRYATSDTIALCTRALELLRRLPPARERDLLEFQLSSTMCQQVSSNSFKTAFAGRDALAVHDRTIELARCLEEPAYVYAAITQLCSYQMIVAKYDEALQVTPELERLEQTHVLDPMLLHSGIFARGYIAFFRAELEEAVQLFERLVPPESDASPFNDNQVGRAVALAHLACARWAIGDADRALQEALATIELAERTKVPVVVALGYVVRARLRFLRRDALDIIDQEMSHALMASSVDMGLHTEVRAFAVWAKAQRQKLLLAEVQPLLDDFQRRLTEVCTNSTLVALPLIDALRSSDYIAEARQLTEEVITFALSHNERVYMNELLRRRHELS